MTVSAKKKTTNTKSHLLGIWSAIPMAVLFGGGMAIARFLPPHSPTWSATQVASTYQAHHSMIIFGLLLMMLSGTLYANFSVAIGFQLMRIERGKFPILSVTQMAQGLACSLLLVLPTVPFAVAAFRPEREAVSILMLNDIGWIAFVWTFPAPFIQYLLIGFCILSDTRAAPLLPRWLGYYNLWFAIVLCASAPMPLFKTGPFAWNGLLSWWLIVVVFFGWIVTMLTEFTKASRRPDPVG